MKQKTIQTIVLS